MNDSDEDGLKELILRAKKGDSDAFGRIYEMYYTPIYRYLYFRLRGNKADAEDLTQEVFLKIFSSFGSYMVSQPSPLPYFYTIARNTLIDRSRKKKIVQANLPEGDTTLVDVPDETPLQDEAYQKNEDAIELRKRIALLPPEQQDVIVLRFIDELSTKEIAEVLAKTEEAVRQLQSRGLKSLRNIFNGYEQ